MEENTSKSFEDIFETFAQTAGLPDLHLDENGDGQLLFDEDIVVNVHYNRGTQRVLVYAIVTDMEGVPDLQGILEDMLHANFFWEDTRGFTLGIDHDSCRVVLTDKQEAALFESADVLATYLGVCVDLVYEWREKINGKYRRKLEERNPAFLNHEEEE